MPIEITIENKKFIVPEGNDPCELWVGYFNSLKKETGKEKAKMLWLITWKTNHNVSCTTNANFNTWLKENGIDVSNAATRHIADVSKIGSNILGMGKNLSSFLSWGVPAALAFIVLVIGIVLWKSSKDLDAKDLAMLTPIGRGAKGALKIVGK
ncbi:hypothetical protein [Aquimarina longa]|uniref:hypothetical protein n=1 Tax=Aquimarina longa TaxID=1080221 RepID=UPI000785722D|nr:hypothetical protein [Aquimarina longa]